MPQARQCCWDVKGKRRQGYPGRHSCRQKPATFTFTTEKDCSLIRFSEAMVAQEKHVGAADKGGSTNAARRKRRLSNGRRSPLTRRRDWLMPSTCTSP